MKHIVKIHMDGVTTEYEAEAGVRILDFLRNTPVSVDTPCGGSGKCGKCRVKVEGLENAPSDREKSLLGEAALKKGMRLACYNTVVNDLEIYAAESETASIVTEGTRRDTRLEPLIRKTHVELGMPTLEDQASDLERVLGAAGGKNSNADLDLIAGLPGVLRSSGFKVTLVHADDRLIGVEPGDTTGKLYGVAFDIGTTTIAAYLYDMNTGRRADVLSMLNPQRKFGADVISRIGYSMASASALEEVNGAVVDGINLMISQFAERNHLDTADIYTAVFVGNTTMMHLLMKLDARNIAASPFIPATTSLHIFPADKLGININKKGQAVMFPSVSAYIGADTVGAILSSGMYESEDICLLIDIGTNGEIVLGGRERLYSCSTAAGPAFEGANIKNGVGGITGAIDTVELTPAYKITTINRGKPVGICGSGIVDVIAQLLGAGIVDETGRFENAADLTEKNSVYKDRLVAIQGEKAFMLASGDESADRTDIAITQKDIRELQNAKAAMAAGVLTLVKRAGIKLDDIKKVYLAGGFGSKINIKSAIEIGLLPRELEGKIESIGNAAGSGAVEGLLSAKMLGVSERIGGSVQYIELSADKEFVDNYIECMTFE